MTASRIDPVPAHTTTVGSLRERFVRGFGWNAVATASTQGSTLIVNIMLANLWSLQVFGEYAMVQSTLAALVAVAQPSTGTAATKYAAELRQRDPDRAGRILGLCGLVSIAIAATVLSVLVGTADVVATRMLERPQLAAALSIGGVAVFFNVISGFLFGSISGLERYRALGKAGMMTGTLYIVVTFAGGYAGGVRGAIIGVAAVACFQVIVLTAVLARAAVGQGIRINPREARKELAVFQSFVAPAALNSLVAYPAIWLGNAFLVKQDQGYAQLALFAAANSFRILVLVVPNILNTVAYSLLNHELGAGHEARYRKLFWTNLGFAAALACAAATSIAVLGPWLLNAFGEEFRAAYPVLLILMLAAIPEPMAVTLVQVVQSRERVWLSFFGMILPAYGTLAILAWVLTPQYGAVGLAWSYAAAMSLALVCSATAVRRIGLWPVEATRA